MAPVSTIGCVVALLAGFAAPLAAQHDHRSPYAGYLGWDIKALSADEVQALRDGAGMGFALAAELNHYPGPRHVLELADSLALTAEQRERVRAVQRAMHAEAVRLGEQVIDRERALDRAFASRTIDAARLRALTGEIGRLRGALRAAHLAAHLEVTAALTPEQIARYDRLRGYDSDP